MFASASALSNCLTRALRRLSSLISPGLSTRITFPLVPLPYCRTHRDTVPLPLMPYFMEMSSNAIPPISSSRTTSILKASLYRISSRLPCFFVFMPDNLCQEVKSWLKFDSVPGGFLDDLWGWLRRFAAERRRVREPERSREAAQWRLLARPGFDRLTLLVSTDSRRQAVHLLRRAVPQRGVGPAGVVQIDRLVHCQKRVRLGFELPSQSILALENAVDPLRQRILRAVVCLGHAHAQPVSHHPVHLLRAAILRPPIRMMDGRGSGGHLRHRLLERRQAPARLQRVATVVAHHLARDLVRQQRQIQESHGRAHIGQIPHPDLIGLAHRQTLDPVGEHRQRVMGVSCAGILRRLGLQQQTLLAQHLQKPVPPQPHPFLGQLPFEHKVQLARAQARLELPFRHHQRRHQLGIHLPTLPRFAPGVIILTGDPHLAAHRADRYPKTLAFQLYGFMPGWPAAFFLNPATSAIPARRQAKRVYARSNAASMFASARALSNCLTLALSRLSSLISPGLSTRITFPLVPLPYCRTHRDTVPLPLMPYFMAMSSNAKGPCPDGCGS